MRSRANGGSITRNLRLLTGALVSTMVLLGVTLFAAYSYRLSAKNREDSIRAVGTGLARLVSRPMSLGDYLSAEESLRGELPRYVCDVRVLDERKQLAAAVSNPRAAPHCRVEGRAGVVSRFDIVVTGPLQAVASAPIAQLELRSDNTDLLIQALEVGGAAFALGLLLLAVLYRLSDIAVRRTLRPLEVAVTSALADPAVGPSVLAAAPLEIRPLLSQLESLYASMASAEREILLGRMAAQVAHDIRSPLAALSASEPELSTLPEEVRHMIRHAIERISDIAHQLIQKNQASSAPDPASAGPGQPERAELLSTLISEIVTEKRLQYRARLGIQIAFTANAANYALAARVEVSEFKRVLSNLIDNAVEALSVRGRVEVTLEERDGRVETRVIDNGAGIPASVLSRLAQRGETFGKQGGSGLGLYHARTACTRWGGDLRIESDPGCGTQVSMILPAAQAPHWLPTRLALQAGGILAVVDDDLSVHQIWQARADASKLREQDIRLAQFSTPPELEAWHRDLAPADRERVHYLVDHEFLGFAENGLDLIERLGIAGRSVLITSRYDEPAVRDRCGALGVPLLPKGMAGFIALSVAPRPEPGLDAVLLDDDPLVHLAWKASEARHGKKTRKFDSAARFLGELPVIDRSVPLYIDLNLGAGMSGLEVAEQARRMGFRFIHLATGAEPAAVGAVPGLTSVQGKDPPWMRDAGL